MEQQEQKRLMKTILKPANVQKIRQFAKGDNSIFQGSKLVALDRLIRLKSEQITGISGVERVLEFSPGEYVGMKRTGPSENFFPCAIKVHYLIETT